MNNSDKPKSLTIKWKKMPLDEKEVARNMEILQEIGWTLGSPPETAHEYLDDGETKSYWFPDDPLNLNKECENFNVLTTKQLNLVVSSEPIFIEWFTPDGDESSIFINCPVTICSIFKALNDSIKHLNRLGDHIFWEGMYPYKNKKNHYIPFFGS